jgi:acyl dehydratase
MTVQSLEDIEFGEDLPEIAPDNSLANATRFCEATGWMAPRFLDHEAAREMGLPGALVPGIMSQGFLSAMIHNWTQVGRIERIDTVFRAPVIVDEPLNMTATVTDIDEDDKLVELDLTVTNAAGETRVFGTAKVRF